MTSSEQNRDGFCNQNEVSRSESFQGTAARTRPLCIEEILYKRKSRKQATENEKTSEDKMHLLEKDLSGVSGDHLRDRSRKEEESTSTRGKCIPQDKDKGERLGEAHMKMKSSNDRPSRGKVERNERGHQKTRTRDEQKSYQENSGRKKHHNDNERKVETIHKIVQDKYKERDGSFQRYSKRKHLCEDDDRARSKIADSVSRKHDLSKVKHSYYSERKGKNKESSRSHYEESKSSRRRSRSLKREKCSDRSLSISPHKHKHASFHEEDHGKSSLKVKIDMQTSNKGRYGSGWGSDGRSSGLGGYSPRKRRTVMSEKETPPIKSPERKSNTLNLPLSDTDKLTSGSKELLTASFVASSSSKPHPASSISVSSFLTTFTPSIDSVHLTQATRLMRRIYVENVPASASNKSMMECFNDFLFSSGNIHIQGTQPCISCIINKEKGQAVLEFLTPEYATSALSFDGRSLFGSLVRVRRPKDYVETTTEVPEKLAATVIAKPMPAVNAISNVVNNSPYKIFVGGVSKALSSNMLMEIVSAFGLLKAYRFEANEELNERWAFMEFVDQSVTPKACAGLNGMKLGGQVLTAVLATPVIPMEENTQEHSLYDIPDHAKPLLSASTKVLKLKNVFNPENFTTLSEAEVEETMEDIRIECARFGTVKSINLIRESNESNSEGLGKILLNENTIQETLSDHQETRTADSNEKLSNHEYENGKTEFLQSVGNSEDGAIDLQQPLNPVENDSVDEICTDNSVEYLQSDEFHKDKIIMDTIGNEHREVSQLEANTNLNENLEKNDSDKEIRELTSDESDPVPEILQFKTIGNITDSLPRVSGSDTEDVCVTQNEGAMPEKIAISNNNIAKVIDSTFEPGSIIVEYLREEGACTAAHCLHGRLYDNRLVEVSYVAEDLFHAKFWA